MLSLCPRITNGLVQPGGGQVRLWSSISVFIFSSHKTEEVVSRQGVQIASRKGPVAAKEKIHESAETMLFRETRRPDGLKKRLFFVFYSYCSNQYKKRPSLPGVRQWRALMVETSPLVIDRKFRRMLRLPCGGGR
ncbi:hypothetical protein C6366_15530 [Desulfonatronum sp. SC1]|nr:hypothetical protein C6366_15530 [Desulfonatronum sp. SC1]